MKIALYPGSFDPMTFGHLDIIDRASKLVDKLYVVIMQNPAKKNVFTVDERIEMLRKVTDSYDNVEIIAGEGLTVEMARRLSATILIRGIRATMDFEQELQLATANMALAPEIESLFFITRPENSFVSSSAVREIASNGGDISKFVPKEIVSEILNKYKNQQK